MTHTLRDSLHRWPLLFVDVNATIAIAGFLGVRH
jgi:hypothetical protein